MIDNEKRAQKQEEKEKVRRRMHVTVDQDNYEYIPAKKQADYYDTDVHQRVGIYVRVSTDDIRQTTSYELQQKYYEDFVNRHSNWTLVKIYADEGISGTSLKHRDAFNEMIADCRAGKLDLIITKSVSRFARNVMITIGMARELARLKPPVGIFFESECIFSLNDDSQMALTFQATMAEEESHTRSRSMETSLRMRLDNGIPLTPKLLGYTHDSEGTLVINPDEAPTVKLAFFMYLFGYSTSQIADAFNILERKTYLGNVNWTSSSIVGILRNERHCGAVFTRKTYTEDFRTHRKLKNRGDRPQSHYFNHHDPIISRDDFIAVQRLLDNAKYGNKSLLPELRVIDNGILKGFVSINPRWSGFSPEDYCRACQSVYLDDNGNVSFTAQETPGEVQVEVEAGDFDLRGFEIARSELFDSNQKPSVGFTTKKIKFSTQCVRKFGQKNTVEILIHPFAKKIALRPTTKENRNSIKLSAPRDGVFIPRDIPASAFGEALYQIMGWTPERRYRMEGYLFEKDDEIAYIFDASDAEMFINSNQLPKQNADNEGNDELHPLTPNGKAIRAIPAEWASNFGKPFYIHEQTWNEIAAQSENEWKLRIQGQLFETETSLHVTPFEELKRYIKNELSSITLMEGNDG